MKRPNIVTRVVLLVLVLIAALTASSCQSDTGIGVGMDYPARWGGGGSGPPIFVGGPSF
jgi:hypothetical protein